ncbi:hypothetical protein [Ferrimonas balearica]|uniref:hypothetical protein n=1 Tax=Ferrimonas balearica TaxID=44012 RepID=UPI001C990986|nr:hypothetical protein [Ferrimonas balearica]MBY5922319.1 hypothetical protein [Ferrimonas balearica]MBY5994341.1 hypothetical protein [Ferrimonas balearica]
MLAIAQTIVLGLGVILVLSALGRYIHRTQNWHAIWQVWVGKLKDLNLSEFRLYRSGIVLLFAGVLLRIVYLTLSGV